MKKSQQGFTLIELIVVIAIIALLAGVVLESVGVARGKGSNAGIKTALAQLRTQSNLYYDSFGSFGTASANGLANSCTTANTMFVDPQVSKIVTSIQSAAGNSSSAFCSNSIGGAGTWALYIALNSVQNGNNWVCTDTTNVIKYYVNAPSIAAFKCP